MKSKNLVSVIVVGVLVVAAVGLFVWMSRDVEEEVGDRNSESGQVAVGSGEGVEGDEFYMLVRLSSREILDKLESGWTGFIYTGRDTCPFCQMFTPHLIGAIREMGMEDTVIYFDTDATLDEEDRVTVLSRLGVTGVPNLQFISGGVTAGVLGDTSGVEPILEFFREWR
ncbi:glutaredoxin [Candidatus Saccharibacteria bacterium]|nr:glutaredoxin [Candidatus Saccharibacteria bacterium]